MLPIWALTSVQTQSDEDQEDIAVILKTLYPVNIHITGISIGRWHQKKCTGGRGGLAGDTSSVSLSIKKMEAKFIFVATGCKKAIRR
jgi:hypothetical protein